MRVESEPKPHEIGSSSQDRPLDLSCPAIARPPDKEKGAWSKAPEAPPALTSELTAALCAGL